MFFFSPKKIDQNTKSCLDVLFKIALFNCDGSDRTSGPPCSGGGGDPEICDDTIDNDGDGDVDCDDSDCIGDPA
jgi:hypothetical protein